MTFDIEIFQASPSDSTLLQDEGRAEAPHRQSNTIKETKDDHCENTQFADWENEGGTYIDSAHSDSGRGSLDRKSFISEHIDNASTFMEKRLAQSERTARTMIVGSFIVMPPHLCRLSPALYQNVAPSSGRD